jgi:hypothetical protein
MKTMKTRPHHKALALALGSLLALPGGIGHAEQPAVPPNAAKVAPAKNWVAAGVVVICVGGYCIYRMAKFCNSHFPKGQTNAQNNQIIGSVGASFIYQGDACNESELPSTNGPASGPPTTFTVNVAVVGNGLRTSVSASLETQDLESFMQEASSQGLTIGLPASYERNGKPCQPGDVPLSFDAWTATMNTGSGGQQVVVEGSADLDRWDVLFTTDSQAFSVVDASETQSRFYRVSLVPIY